MKWRSTVVPMCAYEWVNHCVRVTVCVCVVRGKMEVGAEKRREECSWSSMLLMLIGPYFNHSHWSVSSLTEQIPPNPPVFLPHCPATLTSTRPLFALTHSHTPFTQSHKVGLVCSFIYSTIIFSSSSFIIFFFYDFSDFCLEASPVLCPGLHSLPASCLPSLTSSLISAWLSLSSPSLIPVEQKSH